METRLPLVALMAIVLVEFSPPTEAAKRRRPAPSLGEIFAPEKLREDFRILRYALEKAHPGLYLYTSKEKFDRLFEETGLSFDKPLTRREFYLRVSPVVEMAKCGHTYFDFPPKLLNHLNREAKLFPLPILFLNQKAYVDLKDGEIPLGSEVVSINGRLMAETITKFFPYIRSDGFNQTMKFRILADEFALHHHLVFGVSEEFEVKYVPFGKKESLMVKLAAIPGAKLQKHLLDRHSEKSKFKNFQFRWIEKEVGLLTVNSFDFGLKKKGRQKYRGFLKETFDEINARTGVKDLIVDVRFNEGGYIGHDAALFSYLAQASFRENQSAVTKVVDIPLEKYQDKKEFFKGVEKSIEKSLAKEFMPAADGFFHLIDEKNKVNQPKKRGFKGNICILISGWTHSGGAVVCSLALNNNNVTFIGQETGGGHEYYTAGNMVLYTLPNTKCQVEVPMILYRSAVPEKAFPKGSGILPKHRVIQTQKDFILGEDTVLQFALDLINQSKK